MSKKEKPLPKPPATPFGRKRRFEGEAEDTPLIADEIAKAAAEGKIEEFLNREMPDNEHARKLAMMMLGMTGMMPPSGTSHAEANSADVSDKDKSAGEVMPEPPEDVVKAVQAGDVRNLMELLKREHEKRSPLAREDATEERQENNPAPAFSDTERQTIEELMKIASENDLTLDWIALRALKRYIEEYRKTGLL